eukprot:TRINITY_DN20715_c0_g1_i1.p1 TRINITY_DN20715_c0_g1~~TRINITY_DN20715_c0_g1_i1.p1  ORF type:complete len:3043 (+),score=1205.51 TRINITY_DN20715_c0_g1_i1:108-9236(+)
MVWAGNKYCMGRSPGGSVGALECLRRMLLTVHSSEQDQQIQIDAVVGVLSREGAAELSDTTTQHINKEVKTLFSGETAGKLLGLRVLMSLITVEYWSFPLKMTFFYNLAKSCLPSQDPKVAKLASQCIGNIVSVGCGRDGGLITAGMVEEEVRRALEWLAVQVDKQNRWYCGCTVLEALLKSTPELVGVRPDLLIDRIFTPIWSEVPRDRLAGVSLFKTLVDVMFGDDQDSTVLFNKVVQKVFEGIRTEHNSAAHGSLMCLRELLATTAGQFQSSDFCNLVDTVLSAFATSEIEIKKVALEVLALMAKPYNELFAGTYLPEVMEKISALYAEFPAFRETAFWALSELATSLSADYLEPHLPTLVDYVREGLEEGYTRKHSLHLLGLLCTVCPQPMEVELGADVWYRCLTTGPLTDNYTETLQKIWTAIPSLQKHLQDINTEVIQRVLRAKEDQHARLALKNIGDCEGCGPTDAAGICSLVDQSIMPFLLSEDASVRLAAVTAALKVLRHAARMYDEQANTPSECSIGDQTSSTFSDKAGVHPYNSPTRGQQDRVALIQPMLLSVVDMCAVDMEPTVRHGVLSGMCVAEELTKLYYHPAIIDCLFMAFNDISSVNRTLALRILCKLPSSQTVFQGLSRICLQLADDNAVQDDAAQQAHCAELLTQLVKMVPDVVAPKAFDILQNVIVRLRDAVTLKNPQLMASLLIAVGELNDLVAIDDVQAKALRLGLLPLILDCLEDRQKRVAAVHCLIKLVRSTGLVIDFYHQYPQVLPILLGFLQSKEDWALQCAVMRLIGTIGAVDPLRAKNVTFWVEAEERDVNRRRVTASGVPGVNGSTPDPQSEGQPPAQRTNSSIAAKERGEFQQVLLKSSLKHQMQEVHRWHNKYDMVAVAVELKPPMRSQPSLMEKLPAVALQALLLPLANSSQHNTHPKAIDAIRLVIKSLSHKQLVTFCPVLLQPILMLLRKPSPLSRDTHSKLFQLLATVVAVLRSSVMPHCDRILEVLREYWDAAIAEAQRNLRSQQLPTMTSPTITDSGSPEITVTVEHPAIGSGNVNSGDQRGDRETEEKALESTPSVPVETLLVNLITLVEEIGKVCTDMSEHMTWVLHSLVLSIQIDRMERMDLIQKCFDAFKSLAHVMREHLHVVLPVLLEPISRREIPVQLKLKALSTLHFVLETLPIKEHTARVLHQLLASISELTEGDARVVGNASQMLDLLVRCIHTIIRSTGNSFKRFVPLVNRHIPALPQYKELHATLDHLESTGVLAPEDAAPNRNKKEPEKRKSVDDTPRIITCVLSIPVEMFNGDSFKRTISTHLKVPIRALEVIRLKGPACTVDFRFHDLDAQSVSRYTTLFLTTVRNGHNCINNSALSHDLRLIEVKEKQGSSITMQVSALQAIWGARGKRKARDWEEWMNRFSVELLKHSPSQALRASFQTAQAYLPLARDLFSYSFVACFQELDEEEKLELLSHMNHALRANLPPFVLHMILSLAEFMEEERYQSTYSTQGLSKIYKMTRPSTDAKFGVGYTDVKYEGVARAHVSKVQPNQPGAIARLPLGGIVNKLNNTRVINVRHLSELLVGQTVITLELHIPRSRVVTKPSPFFDIDLLADVCEGKQLLAKALHYKEERFRELMQEAKKSDTEDVNTTSRVFVDLCGTLIHLSNYLGLREAANGVLDYYKKYFEEWAQQQDETGVSDPSQSITTKLAGNQLDSMLLIEGRGYEKLQWWSQAIKAYKSQIQEDSGQRNRYMIGIMRCYKQLGRWEHLLYEAKRWWPNSDIESRAEVAGMAAHGAWVLSAWSNLGGESLPSHWDFMETCVQYMPTEGERAAEREFLLAVLSVHKEKYHHAEAHISNTRKLLEGRLSSLVGESYARAYNIIVWLQKVMGLEEVIEYNLDSGVKWTQLREVWHKRMFGMQPTVENWQDMLAIMALVLEKGALTALDSDDLSLWLKFVSICRRCNRNSLAESTLLTLMGSATRNFRNFLTDDTVDQHLSAVLIDAHELAERNVVGHVCLSYFKHLYHCDMRTRAAEELTVYLREAVHIREKAQKLRSELEQMECEESTRTERAKIMGAEEDRKPFIRRSASTGDITLPMPLDELHTKIQYRREELRMVDVMLSQSNLDDDELMAKLHLTIGEWGQELHKDNFWELPHRQEILSHFEKAVNLTKMSSRAWHCWGLLNYRIAFRAESFADDPESAPISAEEHRERKERFLVEALTGFFNSLDFLEDESFCVPNLLRILTIWFRYAQRDNIERELLKGIRAIRVSIWIYVLPQLVARVSFPQLRVRNLVEELLTLLGAEYPHHVVYPLTVCAFHGDTAARRRCAETILDRLAHGEREKIFAQAKVVSQGLIRTAISWPEYWASGIEDAAKVHTEGGSNDELMKKILLDLYLVLDEPDPTVAEQEFIRTFQTDLDTAKRYLVADNLERAWDQYRKTCFRLQEMISKRHSLLLTEVAPQLMEGGFETAVPGVNQPTAARTVLIHSFVNEVKIIQSKQKPKVVIILGDDGQEYKFLLKGHEDIRQDERVMQLFGLINALFQRADDLYHIHIMTTPVVPLSDNVGLIGWLERTETLYHMISDHRHDRSIPVNLECTFIMRMGQLKNMDQFYTLSDLKKQEILAACLEKTPSDCLRRVIWNRTPTSELWLEYRTQYVRTLAAMSMVGYILGLGDRHLNNMMLTNEGKIVHIDFGDCFEVALNRQRFPEQVPFRLTRLLVQAMEASGTDGTFRYTCESVMRCLRKNRDSLTSLLETFVYDPLINWRLLETVAPEEAEAVQEREAERAQGREAPSTTWQEDDKPDFLTAAVTAHQIPDDQDSNPTVDQEPGVDEMHIPADDPADAESEEIATVENDEGHTEVHHDNMHGVDIAAALLARSAQLHAIASAPRSAPTKSVKYDQPREAWEGELVNEKAKQVVIRIRQKLTGYDFPKAISESRNSVSPKPGVSPKHEPLDAGMFDTAMNSRYMMLGAGSYEGSWVKTLAEDDECDIGVSVAHRETWWLNGQDQGDASEDKPTERCTVSDQVHQLILSATSVNNLSKMYIGWCPFW